MPAAWLCVVSCRDEVHVQSERRFGGENAGAFDGEGGGHGPISIERAQRCNQRRRAVAVIAVSLRADNFVSGKSSR
jgi:hypothetical protein